MSLSEPPPYADMAFTPRSSRPSIELPSLETLIPRSWVRPPPKRGTLKDVASLHASPSAGFYKYRPLFPLTV